MSSDDEEYEQLTAAQVLIRLNEAWVNEKLSPYLLETQQEVVDCLIEQCNNVENNFVQASPFAVGIHQLELQRIRYLMTDYVRTRINKIQQYTEYSLEEEQGKSDEDPPHLSPAEFIFAREYHRNTLQHFKDAALQHMPASSQTLKKEQTMIRPNLNSFVVFKVKEDVEDVQIDQNEAPVNLSKDEIHICQYHPISTLLEQGKIALL